jgi:hypothetical protein
MEIAVRLADEGVPLAVIARAVQVRSEDLRQELEKARENGRLLDMPRRDWWPHDCRSRRVVAEDRDQQQAAIQVIFGATRTEASLLMELVRQGSLCRARYPSQGAVDVHVFNLRRRLAPHDIAIISVHGHGYRLNGEDRARLMVMIERARAA